MFWKLILHSVNSILINRGVLIKTLKIPFFSYLLLFWIVFSNPETGISFFARLFAYLLYPIFAIITHRVLILGPESVSIWGSFVLTRRERTFFSAFVGLVLISGIYTFALSLVEKYSGPWGIVGQVAVLISYLYITSRFALVFPAIAVDEFIGFKGAWELTKGYGILMMMIVSFFPLLLAIPNFILVVLISPDTMEIPSNLPFINLFSEMLNFIFTIFIIAALSVVFLYIIDEKSKV